MRPRAYVLVLLTTTLICAPLLYVGTWATQVIGCRTLTRPGAYLAACDAPAFGSYEHEAYFFDEEPASVAAMQQADVLFLGNSRLQIGFSTPELDAFFRDRAAPYHLLGFGYGESSLFSRRLLQRFRPKPKVVVINADPFFVDVASPPADDIARAPKRSWAEGWMKRIFGQMQPALCRVPGLCNQSLGATFRDHATGQWIWHDVLVPTDTVAMAITPHKASTWSEAELPAWTRMAEAFIAATGLPRSCIILTGVPTPALDAEGLAASLAQRLGLTAVLPVLDGLTAMDNSHLSAASAGRWSAAFLQQAAPAIDACLARP